jgi:MFS family permease
VLSPHFFYLFSLSVLSVALGIQIILLPWLVVDQLSLSSIWVGWLQAAVLIPNLLLLLLGGVSADRGNGTRLLVPLLLINMCVHGVLAYVLFSGWLSIAVLMVYAVILGICNAFVQPWREYLLKQVDDSAVKSDLQSLVAKSGLCVYIGQAVGVSLSSFMADIGAHNLLLIQLAAVLLAVVGFRCLLQRLAFLQGQSADDAKITPNSQVQASNTNSTSAHSVLAELRSGWSDLWALPALRSLICLVAFNGFFHIGVFIVALPLLVQQVYGQPVIYFSGLQLAFLLGTITTTILVIIKGTLDAPGRRVIFGLLYGGVILFALSAKPTLTGLFILLFFWGVVVGVSSTMGRAILQALAPEACRGRIISIYQLALFGCAPLGALFAGYAIHWWGLIDLLKFSGIASLAMFAGMMATRALWEVPAHNEEQVK